MAKNTGWMQKGCIKRLFLPYGSAAWENSSNMAVLVRYSLKECLGLGTPPRGEYNRIEMIKNYHEQRQTAYGNSNIEDSTVYNETNLKQLNYEVLHL